MSEGFHGEESAREGEVREEAEAPGEAAPGEEVR
jgi:hypothetical protein